MFDEWHCSNFFACYPANHSSFYPKAECLAEPHSKENFRLDSTMFASAFPPTIPFKWQESISVHGLQNHFEISSDFSISSGPPPQTSPSEPTLRTLYHREGMAYFQASSPSCILSKNFKPAQSQLSHSWEADARESDALSTGNYGAYNLSETQLPSKGLQSGHQILPTLQPGGVDRLRKTDSSESLLRDLSHYVVCPSSDSPVMGTCGVPAPPISLGGHHSIGKQYAKFSNSQSTLGRTRYTLDLMEIRPTSAKREFDKANRPSGPNTVKIKRFTCPECGQKFARAFNLQTHIATHAGARPFACPADGCFKAFSRRHDLGRHITAIHHQWLTVKNGSTAEAVGP